MTDDLTDLLVALDLLDQDQDDDDQDATDAAVSDQDDLRTRMDQLAAKVAQPDPWAVLVQRMDDLLGVCQRPTFHDLLPAALELRRRLQAAKLEALHAAARCVAPVEWADLAAFESEVSGYAELVGEWQRNGWRSSGGNYVEYPDTLAADGRREG